MLMEERLKGEAQAFNHQIYERIQGGHIPDLRRTQICDYFYNNSWRHPEYVKMDMGEQFALLDQSLKAYLPVLDRPITVLEVGCGPGWLSLELARAGYNVIGIDISNDCIAIAQQFADSDPWKSTRSKLCYIQGDFFTCEQLIQQRFDAVIFLASLHHFKEQQQVMQRAAQLLQDHGIILAHEPTRDRVTESNAVVFHMLQMLVSLAGGYYKQVEIPPNVQDLDKSIQNIYQHMKYEDEQGQKTQSTNDNEAGFKEMYAALTQQFQEVLYEDRYAFFHEIIGGLRFEETANIKLARYIKEMDHKLCKLGSIQATEFFFVGKKR